jgi:hypothetical protein
LSASVMWCTYGGCSVLTRWVSPFWGLPASLCALLTRVDSLTSHRMGRRGLGGHVRALRVLQLYPFPPHEQLLVAVVLGPGVVAVLGIVMVLRPRHHYSTDKTYH